VAGPVAVSGPVDLSKAEPQPLSTTPKATTTEPKTLLWNDPIDSSFKNGAPADTVMAPAGHSAM
jgi:hypothetical protein